MTAVLGAVVFTVVAVVVAKWCAIFPNPYRNRGRRHARPPAPPENANRVEGS